eukprot:TRINITY_DN22030_c0_g1_i1.p1 TRINITY_DN22030_c0_g1~~TRINITY_DN22030_c0_g1_i1.p1  ORF type:complete len:142 (-),score=22.41 TRINITY_DN22030_c0_g1_i1:261-686(-)
MAAQWDGGLQFSKCASGSDSGPVSDAWWDRRYVVFANAGSDDISVGQAVQYQCASGSSESCMGHASAYSCKTSRAQGVVSSVSGQTINVSWTQAQERTEDLETRGSAPWQDVAVESMPATFDLRDWERAKHGTKFQLDWLR